MVLLQEVQSAFASDIVGPDSSLIFDNINKTLWGKQIPHTPMPDGQQWHRDPEEPGCPNVAARDQMAVCWASHGAMIRRMVKVSTVVSARGVVWDRSLSSMVPFHLSFNEVSLPISDLED